MSKRPVIVAVVLALAATGCALAGAGKARPVLDSSARPYFEQSKIAQAELVDVRLAGCKGIDPPGRSARQMTDRFSRDLALIAPAPWRAGL